MYLNKLVITTIYYTIKLYLGAKLYVIIIQYYSLSDYNTVPLFYNLALT